MNNIESFYGISITELDADNLFFSVVTKGKEKAIFDEKELLYTDTQLNRMIEETARLCGKGYIKEDSARIMLKNIFMILDSVYALSEFREIIACIKEKKLWEMWQNGVRKSIAAFDRTKKNFYHLEHFYYKLPQLRADFAISLKNDYAFSNIYTHSFDNAVFTKAFFALPGNESFDRVCERSEMLCTETALMEKLGYEDILPVLEERASFRVDGGIKYTALLVDAIIISMCFASFYRCDGVFPEKRYAKQILDELVNEEETVLIESFESYINMAVARYGVSIVPKADSFGENILNVYASRLCEENISLLAKHLTAVVCEKRVSEKGLKNLIHFI